MIVAGVAIIAALAYYSARQEPNGIIRNGENGTGDNGQTRMVRLYYYSPTQDQDMQGNILCSRQGLVAVDRQIPVTQTPIQDTIRLLLRGDLTAEERSFGITTEYPLSGVELEGASLNNGVLTLEFSDPQNRTSGGSCRVSILWHQIESTALQFPEVSSVRFIPEELFQP